MTSALCLLVAIAPPSFAQQDEAPLPPPSFVLHAYANLIQVPTLVMNSKELPPPPITRERFTVSLDAGPRFHPTQMRVEGDDPISLAVVLDDSGRQTALLSLLSQAIGELAPQYLHPDDHITVYIVDCKIFRTTLDKPASAPLMKQAVAAAFVAPKLHGAKTIPACGSSLRLWDSIALAAKKLAESPGRRVMLIVSAGEDGGSAMPLRVLSEFLSSKSIAAFALQDAEVYDEMTTTRTSPGTSERPLELLCGVNGGFVLRTDRKKLNETLRNLVMLLRSRYILEFPAPDKGVAGVHNLDIRVTKSHGLTILATGASSTVPDDNRANDPNTIKSAPSPAVFGPRRSLPPDL